VRSAELDHREAVGLFLEVIGETAADAGRHVSRVIAKKNLVEYKRRFITQKDAREMVEHAQHFFAWVIGILLRN